MDSGLIIKPAASVARTSGVRRNAVVTELAPPQTVTAVNGAATTSANTARTPVSDPSRMGDVILDPHSREVIYRSADAQSRRVVRQMPEIAARRLKAYTCLAKDRASPHDSQADIEV